MPGQGFAPKLPESRRTRHVPQRGEWTELPQHGVGAPAPSLDWSARTVRAWTAWWSDPASTQWSDADIEAVWALAELMDDGLIKHAAEIRQRTDILGLSAKGRQDRRWRIVEPEEKAEPKTPAQPRRRNLNVVA